MTETSTVKADRDTLRRRALALAGMWFLLCGILTALTLVVVALVASALLLLAVLAAATPQLLRRFGIRGRSKAAVKAIAAASRTQKVGLGDLRLPRRGGGLAVAAKGTAAGGLRRALVRLVDLGLPRRGRRLAVAVRGTATRGLRRAPELLDRAGQRYAAAAYRAAALTSRILWRLLALLQRLRPRSLDRRRARWLNERGARLRRAGDPGQAAEQHRLALAIVRDLGDRHAEALTLNSLGLALAHAGADAAALQRFEEALAVLRTLGDTEHEGQVIANIGAVHGRQGRGEEAVSLLHAALDKLPPQSSAYRRVEQQLRRAS